jgi:hypothetical protein
MDDWNKEIVSFFEGIATDVENFFQEVGLAIEDLHSEMTTGLEQMFREIMTPELEEFMGINELREIFSDDLESLVNPKVEPDATTHPACIGCQNYHGRIYGGNLLVCGMHPHGWEGDRCPDWESN